MIYLSRARMVLQKRAARRRADTHNTFGFNIHAANLFLSNEEATKECLTFKRVV